MTQVFVSYSRKDSQYVHLLINNMKWNGIHVWIDDRIDSGSKWPHEIEKNLDESQAVILILSSSSKNSEWVQNELAYAQGKKKKIFPLLLEGGVWLSLAATQSTDVRGGKLPPAEFYENLRQSLKDENPWSKSVAQAWKSQGTETKETDAETTERIRKAWNLKGWNDEE